MSEPDRLTELRRQRALIQEHVSWLDHEIAAEEKRTGVGGARVAADFSTAESSPASGGAPAAATAEATEITARAEAVMDEYRVTPSDLQRDVRRGCFIYFFAALALVALIVSGLYLALRH